MKFELPEKVMAVEKIELSESLGKNAAEIFYGQKGKEEKGGSFQEIAAAKAAENMLKAKEPSEREKERNPLLDLVEEEEEAAYFRPEDRWSGPTREQQRQFKAEQRAKWERRRRYRKILIESAIKRKLDEQERNKRHYKKLQEKELMEEAHEKNILGLPPEKRDSGKKVFGYEDPNGAEQIKAALLEAKMAMQALENLISV